MRTNKEMSLVRNSKEVNVICRRTIDELERELPPARPEPGSTPEERTRCGGFYIVCVMTFHREFSFILNGTRFLLNYSVGDRRAAVPTCGGSSECPRQRYYAIARSSLFKQTLQRRNS